MNGLILCTGLKWGVPPGGIYRGQRGLLFYVVTRGDDLENILILSMVKSFSKRTTFQSSGSCIKLAKKGNHKLL